MIKEEVQKWQHEGANILYRHRVIRDGYKAGNLKSAMNCSYVKDYEFVAIFDADFQPTPDFLKRTVTHFKVPNSMSYSVTHHSVENYGLVFIMIEEVLIICNLVANLNAYVIVN